MSGPSKGGRPTRFEPELGEMLVSMVAAGVPRAEMVERCGIGRRTLQEWLSRGRGGEPRYAEWAERFTDAWRLVRRKRVREAWARERFRSKKRWQRFKAARQSWWRELLGDEVFWSRRLRWLASKGHTAAYQLTVEQLQRDGFEVRTRRRPRGGFRTNVTP